MTALVVQPDVTTRLMLITTLSAAGFLVSAAEGFESGRALLSAHPPAVVVAGLKLAEYNGLHLVLHAKAGNAKTAALVITDETARVFEREAHQMGATLVVLPIDGRELVAAVTRTLFRDLTDSAPIHRPFERRLGERRNPAPVGHDPDRRQSDRRRPLSTLVQAAVT